MPDEMKALSGSPPDYVQVETPREASDDATNRLEATFENAENPDHAKSKQSKTTDGRLVPFLELFTYADATDKLLMALGTIGALGTGASRPAQIILFGNVINSFNPSVTMDPDEFRDDINTVSLNFTIVGIATMIAGFMQVTCWSIAASRQTKRIRSKYVNAIITKEIGWFDVNDPMELASRVADSSVTIQEGIGAKASDAIHFLSTVITGLVIGFVKGWQLALIMLAVIPFVAASGLIARKVLAKATQDGIAAYAKAGAIAQESLSNIRTVHMFNAIDHFVDRYAAALNDSARAGIKKALSVGWGTGLTICCLFCAYALGFFIGAVFIANDQLDGNSCSGSGCYDGARVLTVFFAVLIGAMALGQAGPCIQAIFSARAAAYDVFEVIQRPSLIDPDSDEGKTLPAVSGRIDIDSISFAYPSRAEVKVCSNYSLSIRAGETVALVGASGSGKSTIISLLERFYDPLSGSVKIDGEDVRDLNVRWLRQQIGLVGQEPVLFATTIMENIRSGRPMATDSEVVEAAKMANAYNFIKDFPDGFATEVGERGTQMSGGQKQRIAIARAIIKNPPILLLDEATSALDTESERIVQESLDRLLAGSKRTTIIVAHRLSTIRGADRIAVHSGGSIVELGSHDELIKIPNGRYALLLEAQDRAAKKAKADAIESLAAGESDSLDQDGRRSRASRNSSKHSLHDLDVGTTDGSESADLEDDTPIPRSRIWKMGLPEWKFMVIGAFGTILFGAVYPVWGFSLTKITVLFFRYDMTKDEMLQDMRYWSAELVGLAVAILVASTLQRYGFGVASERMIARVRQNTFNAMLRQEIGWFDLKQNSSGALVSRLAADSAILQGITSDFLNQKLLQITTLGIAFALSFAYSWQITLAMMACVPLMLLSTFFHFRLTNGKLNAKKDNDADSAAGSLLSEAIDAIRTVASFNMEKALTKQYVGYLEASDKEDRNQGLSSGAAFGFSQGVMFWSLAFIFYLGSIWVSNGHITFEHMLMVIMVLMMSTIGLGVASQDSIDPKKARLAAQNIFRIIDRTPLIDANTDNGKRLETVQGQIDFHRLHFAYPSRPDATIYNNYSLHIQPGQTVALVGASGSGKSTAIALLERFYDPTSGSVSLDGHDIRDLNLPWLRERISLVSQEPVLFAGTIADNIAMGKPGATREEVIQAARSANAYDFIANFPDGFDTDVGDRGAQVSGGQKQRIAIARAILRDPDVLLLDEATSALDNESERVVQASLDALLAAKRRTTVVVAHRLSTIRNADVIAVTQDGAIVELGSHEQLMQRRDGIYRKMVAASASEV